MFPRIPERGIRGKRPGSILNVYVFFQTIVFHLALYVLRLSKGSEMQKGTSPLRPLRRCGDRLIVQGIGKGF
ncbi:hypothetical protein D3OALGA1CA_5336 [Olavius algarvensis associated proteobacterium Delta 3]|nr:hypothetical protein D3OALGB2SA_4947 [Olavius algarvensis associated proteobacterium Delta 3]CAB5165248.1 hypothetical protein D3OALGA1CA_5336 [Olavius algarvensis associated proteobacterium Delta 3]